MSDPVGPVDVGDLPPMQYLVLEVLAARWRLGERCWTFPARLRPAMRALEGRRLISWKHGVVGGTVLAWLTVAGREAAMDPAYRVPAARR